MDSARKQKGNAKWLVESGAKELELLLRAVLYHSSQAVLITDDKRNCLDASFGAAKLLGLSRDQIVGLRLDDLVAPSFKPQMERLWQTFLEQGQKEGTLPQLSSGVAKPEIVRYAASSSVLPARHLVVLSDGMDPGKSGEPAQVADNVPSWVKDFALLLLGADGRVAAWYTGAERTYGYKSEEALGQPLSFLYPSEDAQGARLQEELARTDAAGRFGSEGWQRRKNGARFWTNALTVALRDDHEQLQGFARVVRDFSDRNKAGQKAPHSAETRKQRRDRPPVVGIVSGEFDRTTDASDAFLAMVGYGHDDLIAGRPYWPDLTPREYALVDERAHEEALIHGACTPYEKEYIRKDGARVRVLVTASVLSLAPFRWTTFVHDLTEQGQGKVEDKVAVGHSFEEIVGDSAGLRRVLGQVEIVAPTDATVLILGETGTGKELVARAIHNLSARRKAPFVTLNCAAIPTGLLESELFGYERGAFTGALSRKIGRFEMAHQGTLFLDEVGDIPLDLQPKLLRALQEKEFERLGGIRTIPIDVRLLAATNRNLTQMMGDNLFRSDLYYRLKVFPITVPPLRDHPDDIPLLTRHFMQKYARQMNRKIDTSPADTMRALVSWSWPGNVRELENFIERAVILSGGPNLRAPLAEIRADAAEPVSSDTLEQVEREHIVRVLRETGGVVSTAATRLGLPRTTLNAMMRKLGISRKDL
jgi:formate hydrogenlyase transcriptional activator